MSDDELEAIYDKSYIGIFYPSFIIGKPLPVMEKIKPLKTHGPQTLFPYILFEQEGKFCIQCSQDLNKDPAYIVVFDTIKEAKVFIDDLVTTFERNFNFDEIEKPDEWKYRFVVHPSSTNAFAELVDDL
jgi:hypothetical protein